MKHIEIANDIRNRCGGGFGACLVPGLALPVDRRVVCDEHRGTAGVLVSCSATSSRPWVGSVEVVVSAVCEANAVAKVFRWWNAVVQRQRSKKLHLCTRAPLLLRVDRAACERIQSHLGSRADRVAVHFPQSAVSNVSSICQGLNERNGDGRC